MPTLSTISAAFDEWNSEIKPAVIEQYGADDYPALAESWNDFTDALCKERRLTALQCHHCPAWDDDMPDDDGAFLLESMGVQFSIYTVRDRPDGLMAGMPAGSRHYSVLVWRSGRNFSAYYSMGPGLVSEPEGADVFASLLSDTSDVEELFETWAENLGYDPDSRRAERIFNACRQTLQDLERMFSPSELSDLRDVFADR